MEPWSSTGSKLGRKIFVTDPYSFKAAILVEHNAPLVVDTIDLPPRALQVGQVLVKLKASGICGAQLGEIAGVKGVDPHMPHLLGHEGSGVVVATGTGVSTVHPRDHVVLHWRQGAVGIHSQPPHQYYWGPHNIGGGWVTTFNEYAVVSENRVTMIDRDVPFDVAALMGCAVTTALGVVTHDAQLKIGQSVAVIGCGGVGLNVLHAASIAGGNPVIGIDIHRNKLQKALEFGATHAFESIDEVQDVLPQGVDVIVETTGIPALIENAYRRTSPAGKTILVGQMRYDHKAHINNLPMFSGRTIMASEGGRTNPTVDIPRYLRMWKAGRLKLAELISHRITLSEINDALDKIRAGAVTGRCLIEFP
jgi:S-(hydroxymethyl)glutathione dehydrogenase/alcohol dehydrogenase